MQTVFIAGATGYLGRYLCAEYRSRGWQVRALVRDASRAQDLDADALIEAAATRPQTLAGCLDGADLVVSALGITRQADAVAQERAWLDVGGPDTYRHTDLAQLAFEATRKPARISRLPDWLRRTALVVLPRLTPRHIHGPAQFFLTALGLDMVGEAHGSRRLDAHFAELTDAGRA